MDEGALASLECLPVVGGERSDEAMTARLSSAEVYDAAAKWAAKLDAGPLSQEEQAALDAWVTLDTRHYGALAQAMALLLPQAEPAPRAKPVRPRRPHTRR